MFLSQMQKLVLKYNFLEKIILNRVVKRGQKRNSYIFKIMIKKIKYVYDITQTLSTDKEEKEVSLWTFDKNKYIQLYEKIENNAL